MIRFKIFLDLKKIGKQRGQENFANKPMMGKFWFFTGSPEQKVPGNYNS